MSKYRAVRSNGYASKREERRALELKLLQDCGEISALEEQVPYTLLAPCEGYPRPIKYIADFRYIHDGKVVVEDSKGARLPMFILKKRLMWQLLGVEIREV